MHPSSSQTISRLALLFPAGVITAFTLGRSLGNLALILLLCFAAYLLSRTRAQFPAWLWVVPAYLAVLIGSLFLYGIDKSEGAETWIRLALAILSTLIISVSLSADHSFDSRAGKILFLMSALALFAYAVRAGYFMLGDSFMPANQLNGLHVAALFPLGLIATRGKLTFVLAYAAVTLAILSIGDSRTEILMLLIGLAATLMFHQFRIAWLIAIVPAMFIVALIYGFFFRNYDKLFSSEWFGLLNSLSSERLTLWLMAIEHPPSNTLIGAGSGQSSFVFQAFDYAHASFHNAFIETWYDGGWIALALLLYAIFRFVKPLPSLYRNLSGQDRWIYSCHFGALLATLTACLLDRGYSTALFNVFMFYCLVVLWRQGGSNAHAR